LTVQRLTNVEILETPRKIIVVLPFCRNPPISKLSNSESVDDLLAMTCRKTQTIRNIHGMFRILRRFGDVFYPRPTPTDRVQHGDASVVESRAFSVTKVSQSAFDEDGESKFEICSLFLIRGKVCASVTTDLLIEFHGRRFSFALVESRVFVEVLDYLRKHTRKNCLIKYLNFVGWNGGAKNESSQIFFGTVGQHPA
jgi:hypothetical protein